MSPFEIPGLYALAIQGRMVFANVDQRLSRRALVLKRGEEVTKFESISYNPLLGHALDTSEIWREIVSEPKETVREEIYKCWINKLKEWSLKNNDTIQFMFVQRDLSCQINIERSIKIHKSDSDLYLYSKIACHRANAILIINFTNKEQNFKHQEHVHFDRKFIGGQSAANYQDVCVRLPDQSMDYEINLSVIYNSYVDDGSGIHPFVFISDIRVDVEEKENAHYFVKNSEVSHDGIWMLASFPNDENVNNITEICIDDISASVMTPELENALSFFDESYYLKNNTDVSFGNIDPFRHYMNVGWKEGRNPNPEFNVKEYLNRHPDVDRQGIEPLLHYANFGKRENRSLGVFDEILNEIWQDSGQTMPVGVESQIFARAQDLMVPVELIDTRKLIVMVVPEHNAMSGGIYSIFSIANQIHRSRHIHGYDVLIMTRPNAQRLTYVRNSAFRNSETVYRFEQLRLFRNVQDLQIHIPEYACVEFVRSLSSNMLNYLLRRDAVHINVLNQNIRLMPERDKFHDLRRLASSIGQSVSHHVSASQECADQYDLPTLLLPAYTDLDPYPACSFEDKENIIIHSDDDASYKAAVLRQLEKLDDYEIIKIADMSFDRYMELATRCRFSVSFGEGFDGYVAQPIYQGGIGLALYTDEFFPDSSFAKLENFFESEEQMVEQIVPTIRRLESNRNRYVTLNSKLQAKWDSLYSYDDYVERIGKLVRQEYEIWPAPEQD